MLLVACVTRHSSHVTHHTSHITHHTSHVSQLFYCHTTDIVALNKIRGQVQITFVDDDTAIRRANIYNNTHFLCRQSYDPQRKTFAPFSESKKGGRGSKVREEDAIPFSFGDQNVLDKLLASGSEVSSAGGCELLMEGVMCDVCSVIWEE